MLVLSRTLVLSTVQTYSADNPVIGWDNLVTISNVTADSALTNHPASNLANPVTSNDEEWRSGSTATQYLTILTGSADAIDYVGIARHNFGTALIVVSIEGQATEGGPWVELVGEYLPADDSPLMFRFTPTSLFALRVKLQPGATAPKAAVLYVGALLVMERGLWVGHTPLRDAIRVNKVSPLAESGDFLGTITIGQWRANSAAFKLISPAFWRTKMRPFLVAALIEGDPFFFSWRPSSYPEDSGFAFCPGNADPVPTEPSHLIDFELPMQGIS